MKKSILVLSMTALCLSVKAQLKDTIGLNIPNQNGDIVYQGVVDEPDKSKADLYYNAQQWFVDYFKSSKDVIQNQDKEEGLIVGKGFIDFNTKVGLGITMTCHDKLTIKIECKDNKFRYTIYDMVIYPPAYNEENAYPLDKVYGKLLGTQKVPTPKGRCRTVIIDNDKSVKATIASISLAMDKTQQSF